MKFNKRIIIDLLVLVIPLIVVFFLTPVCLKKFLFNGLSAEANL